MYIVVDYRDPREISSSFFRFVIIYGRDTYKLKKGKSKQKKEKKRNVITIAALCLVLLLRNEILAIAYSKR